MASHVLSAAPNPLPADSPLTTISWATGDDAIGQVWVSPDGGAETLFAEGPSGSQTADWIRLGSSYEFRLYAGTSRAELLNTVRVARFAHPNVGSESFGSLRRVTPVSGVFGFDRGKPIDRHYIDRFLTDHADDIHGRVLEIGESTYARRFGGSRVSTIDVLHVKPGNPEATIVADLATGEGIPSSAFDCVVLLQTLHLIFDAAAVVRTLHRILRPGGVVLATFPGISQRARDEWGNSWHWGFTTLSSRLLFSEVFGADHLTIRSYGNVLVTAAFLYGLATSELTMQELDHMDDRYEMLVAVRAMKAAPQ